MSSDGANGRGTRDSWSRLRGRALHIVLALLGLVAIVVLGWLAVAHLRNSPQELQRTAEAQVKAGDYQEARNTYARLKRLFPETEQGRAADQKIGPLQDEVAASALLKQGDDLRNAGKLSDALASYKSVRDKFPGTHAAQSAAEMARQVKDVAYETAFSAARTAMAAGDWAGA